MNIKRRIEQLEAARPEDNAVRVLWVSIDGTYTDAATGEVFTEAELAPRGNVIALHWPEYETGTQPV